MAHDVFISYEQTDKPTANTICTTLESAGIKCWIAPRDVVGPFGAAIVTGIRESKAMILVLSSHANTSPYVSREVVQAVKNRIPICTLRVENVQPSKELEFFISSEQWLEVWDSSIEQCIPLLIQQLKLRLPPSPESGENVTPRHVALRYNCWRKDIDERFKKWDEQFNQHVYRLDLTIVASWDVLTRIAHVEYFLHPSWKAAGSQSQRKVDDETSNFKLKELIWGNFLLYAEAHLKNGGVVPLSCYVQLPELSSGVVD